MSAPAQKWPPAPVRITARGPLPDVKPEKISARRRHIDNDTALRFAGRLSVTVASPPASSTTISSAMAATHSPSVQRLIGRQTCVLYTRQHRARGMAKGTEVALTASVRAQRVFGRGLWQQVRESKAQRSVS